MSEWIKRLAEKYSEVNEKKLTGNQHKLDMDKDGDIDGDDFKQMRKKKKTNEDEVVMNPKNKKDKADSKDTMAAEAKVDEISMDKATSTYAARKSQAQAAAHQGSMDYAKKQMAKARKTKAYMDKKESVEEATMDTAAGRKKASAEADTHHKAMVKKWGADHPATKDAANAAKVMKQKAMESTLPPVYARIVEERAKHYKGATKPEDWDEKEKNNKGAMDMKKDMAVNATDKISNYDELGHDDASKAGRATNAAKTRPGDNAAGDKKVVNPVKGATS